MKKVTALLIASTLALGAVNMAYAADNIKPNDMKSDGVMMHHKGGRDGGHEKMFKGLNLSETQKQQMRTIMQETHDQMNGVRQEEKRAMHNVIVSEHFDKAQAQAQIDKMAENDKARMTSHLETQNKIYNILTPEQKKQFNDKFEKRLTEHSAR